MYIYRFLDKDENIIYIGKTHDIKGRLNNHNNSGHLSSECYCECSCVQYIELSSASDRDVYEIYFINKYKPKYNKQSKRDDELTIKLPEDFRWKEIEFNMEYTPNISKDDIKSYIFQSRCLRPGVLKDINGDSITLAKIANHFSITLSEAKKRMIPIRREEHLTEIRANPHVMYAWGKVF